MNRFKVSYREEAGKPLSSKLREEGTRNGRRGIPAPDADSPFHNLLGLLEEQLLEEDPNEMHWDMPKEAPDYQPLVMALNEALQQAQSGKGKERHAAGEDFIDQEICTTTRAVGLGYPCGQARKKAREAKRMNDEGKPEAAVAELLGAINYLATAVIVIREESNGNRSSKGN